MQHSVVWAEADANSSCGDGSGSDGSGSAADGSTSRHLAAEPVFCFETTFKCVYWSVLAYRHEEFKYADAIMASGEMASDALQVQSLSHCYAAATMLFHCMQLVVV